MRGLFLAKAVKFLKTSRGPTCLSACWLPQACSLRNLLGSFYWAFPRNLTFFIISNFSTFKWVSDSAKSATFLSYLCSFAVCKNNENLLKDRVKISPISSYFKSSQPGFAYLDCFRINVKYFRSTLCICWIHWGFNLEVLKEEVRTGQKERTNKQTNLFFQTQLPRLCKRISPVRPFNRQTRPRNILSPICLWWKWKIVIL